MPLVVTGFTPDANGFAVRFNHAIDPSVIDLSTGPGIAGADVIVVGRLVGQLTGTHHARRDLHGFVVPAHRRAAPVRPLRRDGSRAARSASTTVRQRSTAMRTAPRAMPTSRPFDRRLGTGIVGSPAGLHARPRPGGERAGHAGRASR
jgi:hypothetical protein